MSIVTSALDYLGAGLSIVPVKSDKTPTLRWQPFQKIRMTTAQAQTYCNGAWGIALIAGGVSGGVEIIDVDCKYDLTGTLWEELWNQIEGTDPDLAKQLVLAQTPSLGYHIYYRCEKIQGNLKLANRPTTESERVLNPQEKQKVLLESRGEKGYAVVAPSPGYLVVQGDMRQIPMISNEQRDMLMAIARSMDLMPAPEKPAPADPVAEADGKFDGLSPFDDYCRRGDVVALLQSEGWKVVKEDAQRVQVLRPGEVTSKTSGNWHKGKRILKVWSSSTAFDPSKGYNPVQVYAMLRYGGIDKSAMSKTSKELYAEGYGDRRPEKKKKADAEKAEGDAPTKEKKKKDPNPKEDPEFREEQTVWYLKSGGINIRTAKFWENVAPNFQLFIKYRTEDDQENITWVLEIKMADGTVQFLEVLHDEFTSARKLKSILATKQLGFKIKDAQLDELLSYLFTKTRFNTAQKVIRYGYHPDSKVYFFSNVAYNLKTRELLTPDEFRIVKANDFYLSMPQAKASQNRYELTTPRNTPNFDSFWKLYSDAHGYENGFVPICFYIFSLFRDMGIRFKNFSPILFLKGGAGTGKSSMVRILTSAFGRKQEGINLKSKNTEAALVKLMSQTSNSVIWFDEYHNEFPHEGLLQAAYDNDGYHKSTSNFNSIETMTVEIHSALALTSNYIPENQIFFSRCVFVPISKQDKTEAQRTAFYELEEMQENGLGQMTLQLLAYRELLEANDNYLVSYTRLFNALKKRLEGQQISERLFANMAQIMAAPYTLQCLGHINLLDCPEYSETEVLDEFCRIGEMYILRQWRIQNESKAVAEFFEIIQMLFDAGQIHDEFHFRIDGDRIKLHFPKLYNLFAQKYRQLFFKSPPDRDTIQTELTTLAGLSEWQQMQRSIRFKNDGTGSSQASTIPEKRACELEYRKLQELFGLSLTERPLPR